MGPVVSYGPKEVKPAGKRLVLYGTTFVVGCVLFAGHAVGIIGDERHIVTVQENDPRKVLLHPGDRLDVIMDRHLRGGDGVNAYLRCMDMGGRFQLRGFICEDVDT